MQDSEFTNPRANAPRLRSGGRQVSRRKDNYKLFASKAADDVFPAHTGAQELRRFLQDGIAGIVTVRVIESLEVIEVEHQDTQELLASDCASNLASQHFFQITGIEKARQRVANRLIVLRLAETQICDRQADLLGEHVRHQQHRFGYFSFFDQLEMQNTDGAALRKERQADIGAIARNLSVCIQRSCLLRGRSGNVRYARPSDPAGQSQTRAVGIRSTRQ